MIELSPIDWLKIGSSIFCIVMLWIYKRKIARLLKRAFTKGESHRFEGVAGQEIRNDVEKIMDEVVR